MIVVHEKIYYKVSPINGDIIFGNKGEHSSRYIGPHDISKRIGNVAYEREILSELIQAHTMCHISMFKIVWVILQLLCQLRTFL